MKIISGKRRHGRGTDVCMRGSSGRRSLRGHRRIPNVPVLVPVSEACARVLFTARSRQFSDEHDFKRWQFSLIAKSVQVGHHGFAARSFWLP